MEKNSPRPQLFGKKGVLRKRIRSLVLFPVVPAIAVSAAALVAPVRIGITAILQVGASALLAEYPKVGMAPVLPSNEIVALIDSHRDHESGRVDSVKLAQGTNLVSVQVSSRTPEGAKATLEEILTRLRASFERKRTPAVTWAKDALRQYNERIDEIQKVQGGSPEKRRAALTGSSTQMALDVYFADRLERLIERRDQLAIAVRMNEGSDFDYVEMTPPAPTSLRSKLPLLIVVSLVGGLGLAILRIMALDFKED